MHVVHAFGHAYVEAHVGAFGHTYTCERNSGNTQRIPSNNYNANSYIRYKHIYIYTQTDKCVDAKIDVVQCTRTTYTSIVVLTILDLLRRKDD